MMMSFVKNAAYAALLCAAALTTGAAMSAEPQTQTVHYYWDTCGPQLRILPLPSDLSNFDWSCYGGYIGPDPYGGGGWGGGGDGWW